MYQRIAFTSLLVLGALSHSPRVAAATYTANCGTNGSSSIVQNQLAVIGSTPNSTLQVTGTCVGDLVIQRADRLTITGLVVTGDVTLDSSTLTNIISSNFTGFLSVSNSRGTGISNVVVTGEVDLSRGSQVNVRGLTMSSWSDSSGVHEPSLNCIGQSECSFAGLTLTGSGTGRGTGTAGLLAASASRMTVSGANISGFDVGVQVWNNATAFLTPVCSAVVIGSNLTTGVFVTDGGVVKIEGESAADAAASGCSGPYSVGIIGNGNYGVLADGGGNAYLYLTQIQNHAIDGIRIQHGSTVRVRSSSVDAATASGRSARLAFGANLYFDEQLNGPAAGSTVAGPVCVASNSTVDTGNSSTAVNVTNTCGP
jgi:hypothetical protein